MPNYGFNENEIISTKTIMIDKDGYHKVVEGASVIVICAAND